MWLWLWALLVGRLWAFACRKVVGFACRMVVDFACRKVVGFACRKVVSFACWMVVSLLVGKVVDFTCRKVVGFCLFLSLFLRDLVCWRVNIVCSKRESSLLEKRKQSARKEKVACSDRENNFPE